MAARPGSLESSKRSVKNLKSTIMWRSYQVARKDGENSNQRLVNMLRSMDEHIPDVNALSSISSSSQCGQNINSYMFSEFPDAWLLSRLPSDFLKTLEDYLLALKGEIDAGLKLSNSPDKRFKLTGVQMDILQAGVKFMVCLSGCLKNHARLSQLKFTKELPSFGRTLLNLLDTLLEDQDGYEVLLDSCISCLLFIHGFYDPERLWQLRFMKEFKIKGSKEAKHTHVLSTVEELILDCFKSDFVEKATSCPQMKMLHLEAIHTFGAVISAHQHNAFQVISPRTTGLVLSLLEPREQMTPLQELASKAFVKMVHIMYTRGQTQVFELDILLSGYFSHIGPTVHDNVSIKPSPIFLNVMLDSIQRLMTISTQRSVLSRMLVEIGLFEKLFNVFALIDDASPEEKQRIVVYLIQAVIAVIQGSIRARRILVERKAFQNICEGIKFCDVISEPVLKAFIGLATEEIALSPRLGTIKNSKVIPVLLNWIPELTRDLKWVVLSHLQILVNVSPQNRHYCCKEGAISSLLTILGNSQTPETYMGVDIEDKICSIIEELASHSITPHNVKQLFSILRPMEHREMPSFFPRMLKSLHVMASSSASCLPKYYFDMSHPEASIALPRLSNFCNEGFTVMCWVNISFEHKGQPTSKAISVRQGRRMLYSIHTSKTAGYEAFFCGQNTLVVAVITKKHYISIKVPEGVISRPGWHHVAITHSITGRLNSKHCEINVYIDGKLESKETVAAPSLGETTDGVYFGSGPEHGKMTKSEQEEDNFSVSLTTYDFEDFVVVSDDYLPIFTPLDQTTAKWGSMTSVQGLLGPIILFRDVISPFQIQQLGQIDTNDCSVFQPNSHFHELASKIVVYYHPKECSSTTVHDVSFNSIKGKGSSGQLTSAECYTALKLKDVLNLFGGAGSLFPILESIELPVKSFKSSQTGSPSKEDFNPLRKISVSLFLGILVGMVKDNPLSLQVFELNNGPSTLGSLLAKVSADKITQAALENMHALIENSILLTEDNQLPALVKDVLFDFRIWTRPCYEVRSGHIQIVSSFVRNRVEQCRLVLGPLDILDVIRRYYLPAQASKEDHFSISANEGAAMRAGLLSCVRYYARYGLSEIEVDQILSFMVNVADYTVQVELISLMLDLLRKQQTAGSLPSVLSEKGVVFVALLKAPMVEIRQAAAKLLSVLFNENKVISGPLFDCLHKGAVAAAIQSMSNMEVSSALIISLMELSIHNSDALTEYITNLDVFMSTLNLLKKMPIATKHAISQQILSLLHLNSNHCLEIMTHPQWEMTFLGLLTETEIYSPTSASQVSPPFDGQAAVDVCTGADMYDRLVAAAVEIVVILLWSSTAADAFRKVCRKFLLCLDKFSEDHTLVHPSYVIKQKIFATLLEVIKRQKKAGGVNQVLNNSAFIVAELFEEFVNGSHSSELPKNLPSSPSVDLDLNTIRCTPELLDKLIAVMKLFGMYEGASSTSVEFERSRIVLRLLLSCLSQNNREYCSFGASQLQNFVTNTQMQSDDVHFLLASLVDTLSQFGDATLDLDCKEYILSVIKVALIRYGEVLGVDQLNGLPNRQSNLLFSQQFMEYSKTAEWKMYLEKKVHPVHSRFCTGVMIPMYQQVGLENDQVKLLMKKDTKQKDTQLSNDNLYYNANVLDVVIGKLEEEKDRCLLSDATLHSKHAASLFYWKNRKRFLTGERGVWSSRIPELYSWKLDHAENFSRMRKKLLRSYPYNMHADASLLRDQGNLSRSEGQTLVRHLQLARRNVNGDEEDDNLFQDLTDTLKVDNPPAQWPQPGETNSTLEQSVFKINCYLILLMDKYPGHLEVTSRYIYFVPNQAEVKESLWYSLDIKFPLFQLREVHSRRYHLTRTGLEFFLIDQTNYFINFQSVADVLKVFNAIISQNTPNLIYRKLKSPRGLLEDSGLTKSWQRQEISNFDYLMQLNTIAGRTYNDLNQYPVFPWVICDYTSEKLDLTNPAIYRNFAKPMGAQSEAMEEQARARYEEFEDPTGAIAKFNFGTHYSNAAGVLHYLLRIEPFTSLHIDLQGGKFDDASRQFVSPERSYKSILTTSSDVKELIPEFFFLPEFLCNINDLDLGKTGTGERVSDVILPPWASSPEEFIRINKAALESEYVSQHLHEWIDLIFGYKQRGPEAAKSCNVFYYCTYEGAVDLSKVDEGQRKILEKMIENFGQTPTQLFKSPHPVRYTSGEAHKTQLNEYQGGASPHKTTKVFEGLDDLSVFIVEVSSNNDPIVCVATPTLKGHTIIDSGNPETLITVTQSGALSIHSWLSHVSSFKTRPFVFNKDPVLTLDRSKWHFIGAPFAHNIFPNSKMFVSSRTNKVLLSCGHWDNSFRVESLEKGKLAKRISYHQDVVTCLALDVSGGHLITGSRDLTCSIWEFEKESRLSDQPLQTLFGHNDEVTCVDICVELDVAASGSKDGTCIIHTVRQGKHVHTLEPAKDSDSSSRIISNLMISKLGQIIIYSELSPTDGRIKMDPCLHVFSINGKHLFTELLDNKLSSLLIKGNYVITGSNSGQLAIRDLLSLSKLTELEVKADITCLSITREHSHLFAGLNNGKFLIISATKRRKKLNI